MESTKLFNFKLTESMRRFLDHLAETTHTSKAQAILDSIRGSVRLLHAGRSQTYEAMRTLFDRIGEDGTATIALVEGKEGQPVANLYMGIRGDNPNIDGLWASAQLINGVCHVYLDVESEFAPAPISIKLGDESVRITGIQLKVGELPWPPDYTARQHEAIHLSYKHFLAMFPELPDPDDITAAAAPSETETVES